MERCKYLLPCGKCDKFGKTCEATTDTETLKMYDSLTFPTKECEHDWAVESRIAYPPIADEIPYYTVRLICRKCRATKTETTDVYGIYMY